MLNISRGKIAKAQKVVVYGPEGIGKTTFAAQFPDPLFVDTEESTLSYDVARIDPAPASWSELLGIVREVKQEKPCKTLVLDTADWAEMLCIEHLCAANKWKSIETPGWGAGYTAVKEEFGKLLNLLSDLVDVGINVVLTAHAMMRKFDRPDEASSYDRWELKLQRKTAPLVKEWADVVLFANYKVIVETVDRGMNQKSGKARGGKRVMYAEHNPCWDAKNRYGLSGELNFDFAVIAPFINVNTTPETHTSTPVSVPTQESVSQPTSTQQLKQPIQEDTPTDGGTKINDLPEYWHPLAPLMERDKISLDDIRTLVCDVKGWLSRDTPYENYPEDMVKGALISNWDKVVEMIRQHQTLTEPVPFL